MKDDLALVVEALSGGPESFRPIIERYQDAVFAVALARLRNFHDAEDIAQEVFIEAFKYLIRLSNPDRLGAWLRSITIHQCIDHLRRHREIVDMEEVIEQVEDIETPYTEMEKQELRGQVMDAIGRLSKKQRETTTLFYIDGYSQEEISKIQEVPIGTVKRRLHDAREKLKEGMIGLVKDVLKSGAPNEDFGKRVFEMLSRYGYPPVSSEEWEKIGSQLQEIGTAGVDGFVKAMNSPYHQTRRFALKILPESGLSQEIAEELLKKALSDTNRRVRKYAFFGLADIMQADESKRADIIPYLLPLLTDPSWHIRSYVIWYLYEVEDYARYVPLDYVVEVFLNENDQRVRHNLERLMRAILDAQDSDKKKD